MSDKKIGSGTLSAFSREMVEISERAGGAVVSLNTRGGFPTSGTIWDSSHVVTADHVLHSDGGAVVTLHDGREVSAEIVGRDPSTDLALLKAVVGESPISKNLDPASLKPGSLAVALSRNSERTLNASLAVVNAIGGEWRSHSGGVIDAYLRLDVSMHAGFSGGPSVDPEGALIGINSSRLSRRSAVAIPVTTVARVVAELEEHGRIRRGYLGIASFPVGIDAVLRERMRIEEGDGLIVVQVEDGSGSEKAGVLQGDILLDLDRKPVRDPEELQGLLGPETVGRTVKLRAIRGGSMIELDVEVGERPQGARLHGRGHGAPGWRGHGGR